MVQCLSTSGNELLRAMEPPRHDDFEPARLATEGQRRRGRRALNELGTWVREMLKRHAKDPVSDVTAIDELSQYLGDEESGGGSEGEDTNPEGKLIFRAKPLTQAPLATLMMKKKAVDSMVRRMELTRLVTALVSAKDLEERPWHGKSCR